MVVRVESFVPVLFWVLLFALVDWPVVYPVLDSVCVPVLLPLDELLLVSRRWLVLLFKKAVLAVALPTLLPLL